MVWAQDGGVPLNDVDVEAVAAPPEMALDSGSINSEDDIPPTTDGGVVNNDFQPPVALTNTQVPFPEDGPRVETPQSVVVILHIDERGDVTKVELVKSMGTPFDQAVMNAVQQFKFQPGFIKVFRWV